MALDQATTEYLTELAASGAKPLAESSPAEARAFTALRTELYGPGPEVAKHWDMQLAADDGAQFTVRVLVPAGQPRALIVYYHGGGWVIGDLDGYDVLARTLANRLQAAIVNVGYRLAPEARYPAAADDAWTALRWAHEQLTEIAGQPVPLLVMGDSAGGNLSAVVAQKARDAGGPALAGQVLIYPVTDADLDNDSYRDPQNQLMLTREAMAWFWDHYAPDAASRRSPDASPLQAADLSGLPPAIVLTAEYDVLRQEGEAYAERLRAAGVPVEQRRFAGQMHGFFTMVNVLPGCADAIEYVAGQLDRQLGAR
jgi:acetyl esterase